MIAAANLLTIADLHSSLRMRMSYEIRVIAGLDTAMWLWLVSSQIVPNRP
jgi:hypothetical protein